MRQLGSAAKGLRKELQLVGNQFLTPLIYGVPTNRCSRAVEAASKHRGRKGEEGKRRGGALYKCPKKLGGDMKR